MIVHRVAAFSTTATSLIADSIRASRIWLKALAFMEQRHRCVFDLSVLDKVFA
jgi:hypothetical protein